MPSAPHPGNTLSPPAADAAAKVDALNERAWALLLSDAHEGLRLATEALHAARAAGYVRGEAYALRASGGCRCRLHAYDAALADLETAHAMFEELNDSPAKAATLNWIGNVHGRRADYRAAFRAQFEALGLQRAAGDRNSEGDSLNWLGIIHLSIGDLSQAMEAFTASLDAKEAVRDKLGIAHCLNNIGNIYGQLGDYGMALDHHTRALELRRELGDTNGLAVALLNVGTTYDEQGVFTRALSFYYEALGLARGIGERLTEANILANLSCLHRKAGDFAQALDYAQSARTAAADASALFVEIDARISAGEALTTLGQMADAVRELKEALALAERIESRRLIYMAHLALSKAHEAAGDMEAALRHFKAYHKVEDEVFNAESERRIEAVIAQKEIERSQREAELLRTRNDELTAANEEKARLLDALRLQAEELERLSREDGLTGLFNRRHVEDALALEWERAQRFSRDLTVVMVDVDHFKAVNDRFSHAAGDRVLRETGRILRDGTRAVDVAGRWGGEEFVLLLVETPPEGAVRLAEKLRGAVEAHDWCAVAPALRVTASFGVAGIHEADSPGALLAAADARLYAAKRAGRNRVASGWA